MFLSARNYGNYGNYGCKHGTRTRLWPRFPDCTQCYFTVGFLFLYDLYTTRHETRQSDPKVSLEITTNAGDLRLSGKRRSLPSNNNSPYSHVTLVLERFPRHSNSDYCTTDDNSTFSHSPASVIDPNAIAIMGHLTTREQVKQVNLLCLRCLLLQHAVSIHFDSAWTIW